MNWIIIEQPAKEFDMKPKTLRNWISGGAPLPPAYKFGGKTLFEREEVNEFTASTRLETSITGLRACFQKPPHSASSPNLPVLQ